MPRARYRYLRRSMMADADVFGVSDSTFTSPPPRGFATA